LIDLRFRSLPANEALEVRYSSTFHTYDGLQAPSDAASFAKFSRNMFQALMMQPKPFVV